MVGMKGDGYPPDRTIEKKISINIGQVYLRWNRGGGSDFLKVKEIVEAEKGGRHNGYVLFERLDKEKNEWNSTNTKLPLNFLETIEYRSSKTNEPKYSLVAETEQEFFDSSFAVLEKNETEEIKGEIQSNVQEPVTQSKKGVATEQVTPEPKSPEENQNETPEEIQNAPEPTLETVLETREEDKEIEARLGLTGEQQLERSGLAKRVALARQNYVEQEYKHNTKLEEILRHFKKLKDEPKLEEAYLKAYKETLEKLREFDGVALQNKLIANAFGRSEFISENFSDSSNTEQKEDIASYTKRYSGIEAATLWATREEVRVSKKSEWLENKPLGEKVKKISDGVFEWYKKQSFPQKMAIGALALGINTGATVITGPAAGIGFIAYGAFRAFTATAGYKAAKGTAEALTHKTMDKFRDNRFSGDTKEINALQKDFKNNDIAQADFFERLNAISQANIDTIDKKLKQKKNQSTLAKTATALTMFGMPLGRYLGTFDFLPGTSTPAGEVPEDALEKPNPINSSSALEQEIPDGAQVVPDATPEAVSTEGVPESLPASVTTPEAEGHSLQTVTVTDAHREKGLWGIIEQQLPKEISEADQNRVTASVQNLINNKFAGLTDAQILDQYGFTSRNISLIHPNEVLKLDALISNTELQEILDGKVVLPLEMENSAVPDVAAAAEVPVETQELGVGDQNTLQEKQSYLNSEKIGFSGPDRPAHPDESYWRQVRALQGNAVGPESVQSQPLSMNGALDSDYRTLLQDPIAEGIDVQTMQSESENLLNKEIWDIDTTKFGANQILTNANITTIESQYVGRSMNELLSSNTDQMNGYPRLGGKGMYLPPMDPGVTLNNLEQAESQYRQNLGAMAEAAIRHFGSSAIPINTPEYRETVREYMMRVTTLYTRARIENPDFKLKF